MNTEKEQETNFKYKFNNKTISVLNKAVQGGRRLVLAVTNVVDTLLNSLPQILRLGWILRLCGEEHFEAGVNSLH